MRPIVTDSWARKTASPSRVSRRGTVSPVSSSMAASLSTASQSRRSATSPATVVFPVPEKPIIEMQFVITRPPLERRPVAAGTDRLLVALEVALELADVVAAELLQGRVGKDNAHHRFAD